MCLARAHPLCPKMLPLRQPPRGEGNGQQQLPLPELLLSRENPGSLRDRACLAWEAASLAPGEGPVPKRRCRSPTRAPACCRLSPSPCRCHDHWGSVDRARGRRNIEAEGPEACLLRFCRSPMRLRDGAGRPGAKSVFACSHGRYESLDAVCRGAGPTRTVSVTGGLKGGPA